MSLSIVTSSMMCLVSNNALKSDLSKFSWNTTGTTISNIEQPFNDRYLTRKRTVLAEKKITQNTDADNDLSFNTQALEDRLNETITSPAAKSYQKSMESCSCKRNDHVLCFESRFRHLTHQTRLGNPDPGISNHFCDETSFFVDFDPCDCTRPFDTAKAEFKGPPPVFSSLKTMKLLETAMYRNIYSPKLMLNPSVFGMLVM